MNILVRRMRVPEEIVDQIRGFIASGELRPGDQLPSERELAERFQVSRASIREALDRPSGHGLAGALAHGGGLAARGNHVWFTIAPLSSFLATRGHIVEQIEVRRMIEPEMGRLAAERAAPEDIARMEQCLREMEADIDAGGMGSEADAAFHASIRGVDQQRAADAHRAADRRRHSRTSRGCCRRPKARAPPLMSTT